VAEIASKFQHETVIPHHMFRKSFATRYIWKLRILLFGKAS